MNYKTDYIIEFPNLKYAKQEIYNYQNNHVNYKENIHFKSQYKLDTAKECKYYDLTDKDCTAANSLIETVKSDDYKFTKVLAGGYMPPHVDPQRTGVLMIPLTDDPSPIVFYDDNDVTLSHTYKCPTMINAKIKHGVPEVEFDRIFLQINYFQPWEEIKELGIH
tara:strand:+ start:867 stop:1358 length:492 start_codon:yes stop_codon:yes gene_type:complete